MTSIKIIIFDLITLFLSVIFGIFTKVIQVGCFLNFLLGVISIIFFVAFAIGLFILFETML